MNPHDTLDQLTREAADVRAMLGLPETAPSGDVYRALSDRLQPAASPVGGAGEAAITNASTRWPELAAKIAQHPNGFEGLVQDIILECGDLKSALLLQVIEPMQERIDDLYESLDNAITQRDYGRDIINDMTIEAHDAAKRIAELEMRLQSAVTAVPGATLVWVEPSTTTSQPGYYTPVYSSTPGVTVTFGGAPITTSYDAHGGTAHLPALRAASPVEAPNDQPAR